MSLRTREAPARGLYQRDHFHGRFICKRCSAEVHDWRQHTGYHDGHDAQINELIAAVQALLAARESSGDEPPPGTYTAEQVPDGDPMRELRDRANAEGNAVAEAGMWRGGWRQARDVFRVRPPARMEAG